MPGAAKGVTGSPCRCLRSSQPLGTNRFGLPRAARITGSEEIRTLFRRGKRHRTRHLDVFVAASPVAYPRLGVVVPKHRHRIVERNRVKRRLREIGRTLLLPTLRDAGVPLDVLVRARPEAYEAPFAELRDQLGQWLEASCLPGQ